MKTTSICLTLTALSTLSTSLHANELTIIPRIEAGFSAYSLNFDGVMPLPPSGEPIYTNSQLGGSLFIYRAGITLAFDKIYVDLMGSQTTDLSDTQIIPELNAVEKWTGDRDEINITIGYQLFESGSIFAGYRSGKIEASGQQASNFSYESDGYYVGLNYGLLLSETGLLSFNIAYAGLDSNLNQKLFGNNLGDGDGDGNGLKYGVAWQDSLSDSVRYTISIDQYNYSTDIVSLTGVNAKMTEKESALRVGISTFF